MREINSYELKQIQLEMLLDFATFCDKNDITYYLGGGTLLGAVRHKGFIPWDDDIDVMMPRPDYENFIKTYKHTFYVAKDMSNSDNYFEKNCKLCDLRTVIENKSNRRNGSEENVYIDLFPIDGLPNNIFLQKFFIWVSQLVVVMHSSTVLSYSVSNRYKDRSAGLGNWKSVLRTIVKFVLIATVGKTNPKLWVTGLHRLLKSYEFKNSNNVAGLVSGIYGTREVMSAIIYEPKVLLDFEGYKFWSPHNYDYYLKRLYGNYMELPPIDKRKSHHNFKAYWKWGCK